MPQTNPELYQLKLVAAAFLFLCGSGIKAQVAHATNTLILKKVNDNSLAEYYVYHLSERNSVVSPAEADSLFVNGTFEQWVRPHNPFNPGVSGKDAWFRLVVKNDVPVPTTFFWTLYNHVDSATLFKQTGNTFLPVSSISGTSVATARPVNSRNFALPFLLQPGQTALLYLRITIATEPIYLPMDLTSREDYFAYEERYWISSNWYWLIGFFLFAGIFNLVLFIFLRDRLHLWYFAYLVCSVLFLFMEDNIDGLILPAWMYRLFWSAGQLNYLLLSVAAGIGILQSFLIQEVSRFTKMGRVLILVDFGFVGVFVLMHQLLDNSQVIALIHIMRTILLTSSFLYQVVAVGYGIKLKNRLAYYYAAAFIFYLIGATLFFLNDIGISVKHGFSPNALAIGLFWELLLLQFFTAIRFQLITRDNAKLRIKKLEQQKSLSAQIILGQDEERQRLAKDLHDDLGNTMNRLRMVATKLRNVPGEKDEAVTEMESLLNKAHADIRNISHDLMPLDLQEEGLNASLRKMFNFLSSNSKTVFQFFFTGDEKLIPKELQLVIYRLFNELSGNIIKHANSSQAVMQCSIYEQYILITAEDNGVGVDSTQQSAGIGLRTMYSRVQLLKGKLTIDSNTNGTTIIIEIPLFDGKKTN